MSIPSTTAAKVNPKPAAPAADGTSSNKATSNMNPVEKPIPVTIARSLLPTYIASSVPTSVVNTERSASRRTAT